MAVGQVPAAKTDAALPDCAFGAKFCADSLLCSPHGIALSEVDDLFNIVYQAVKHRLDIHLGLTSEGEPVHILACANVAKPRANDCLCPRELPCVANN